MVGHDVGSEDGKIVGDANGGTDSARLEKKE
jgi:hypothetical protein